MFSKCYYVRRLQLPTSRRPHYNMTKYLQAKYEALVLNDIPLPTEVKVNKFVTNHTDEFTRKELDDDIPQ